jgi:putative tryptophan/tyrosine transport system substrate-binding protein
MKRRVFITFLGGAAAAWPLAARAQQPAMPVIGFMSSRSPEDSADLVEAYRGGLKQGGFVDGENVAIEFRWARGDYSLLPALAADLVSCRVNVITAVGGDPSALAAKRATSTIPIVATLPADPIAAGLVESFNRPGGNVTGFSVVNYLIDTKRLGLLRELAPGGPLFGALVNPNFPPAALQLQGLEQAARAINQPLFIARAGNDSELDAAFASLKREGVGALLVAADPYFDTRRDRIVAFAAQQRLPAIYQFRQYALAGGLLSYGWGITNAYRDCGDYTAKILKGAKPADLPVLQASKFELIINMKTAKALGIKISDNLISLADEVIE